MKKKILFIVLVVVSAYGVMIAKQGNDFDILSYGCPCCETGPGEPCYEMLEGKVYSCGIGYNICDVAPPPEGV